MSAEHSADRPSDPFVAWLRGLVPAGATPTGWCHQPVHRHILEKAPDVLAATKDAISQSFGDAPHVVVELRADEPASQVSDEIAQALDRTDGGVLLVGVGYEDRTRER